MGGSCRPQHTGFIFVEADDMTKVTELLRPTMGRDECVVTPVTEDRRNPSNEGHLFRGKGAVALKKFLAPKPP
ncbi:MAG: hypothetical protein CM1200mP27_10440 [Chloroflexota bacterium]|nr:MAG: hypothetical protein CM1200mP27_10440 [Chloroflexota bacterium]